MPERSCAYIDGESHYIRCEKKWQELHGATASLECLRYKDDSSDKLVLVNEKAKVFWTRRMNPEVLRAVYFTCSSCNGSMLHEIKLSLRAYGLEPAIYPERKPLADQRTNLLVNEGIIEKAKQVDIALAVRVLEDANKDAFDVFHLYTSDVDFLPVIKAVMGRGKQVRVYGHKSGLGSESPLLHDPDQFIDLGEIIQSEFVLVPSSDQR
jgi:uncharacterized LabA/DUF88 family protein